MFEGWSQPTPGWRCRHEPGGATGDVAVSFVTSEGAHFLSRVCFSTHFQKSGASGESRRQTFLISRQFKLFIVRVRVRGRLNVVPAEHGSYSVI